MSQKSFINFLESLRTPTNQSLIEAIHQGYQALTESLDKETSRNLLENTSQVIHELKAINDTEQKERNEYANEYLAKIKPFNKALTQWIKDKNRDPNDVFDDNKNTKKIQQLIKDNIKEVIRSKELNELGLMVVHMDNHPDFQKWFLQFLPPTTVDKDGSPSLRGRLEDRINNNAGKPQQYGTQNADAVLKSIYSKT